jgi:hypothetical protein
MDRGTGFRGGGRMSGLRGKISLGVCPQGLSPAQSKWDNVRAEEAAEKLGISRGIDEKHSSRAKAPSILPAFMRGLKPHASLRTKGTYISKVEDLGIARFSCFMVSPPTIDRSLKTLP